MTLLFEMLFNSLLVGMQFYESALKAGCRVRWLLFPKQRKYGHGGIVKAPLLDLLKFVRNSISSL